MTQIPWSVSAHAKDVWTIPEWEKREKLADCQWLVTCTRYNANHLASLSDHAQRVTLVYHGLDDRTFAAPEDNRPDRDGSNPGDPVQLLSVGRAVEKKGYDVLLSALSRLPSRLHWRLVHIGGGPLIASLRKTANQLGLGSRIAWRGPQSHQAVLAAYRAADAFVLACRITGNGDRDGLPNVFMEAQSQGLACLATTISGIPELIVNAETGLLVPPDDPNALARSLQDLMTNPDTRRRLGRAGQQRVRQAFCFDAGIDCLAERFKRGSSAVRTSDADARLCVSPSMRP